MNQIAANQVDKGVRIRWKIVPAVTDVCRPQSAHIHLALAVCQLRRDPQTGQTNPSGRADRPDTTGTHRRPGTRPTAPGKSSDSQLPQQDSGELVLTRPNTTLFKQRPSTTVRLGSIHAG